MAQIQTQIEKNEVGRTVNRRTDELMWQRSIWIKLRWKWNSFDEIANKWKETDIFSQICLFIELKWKLYVMKVEFKWTFEEFLQKKSIFLLKKIFWDFCVLW